LVVTVIGVMKHHRQFDASVEASGPHGFAVRVRAVRQRRTRVHRIPHPTLVTIAIRPSQPGGTARGLKDDLPDGARDNFRTGAANWHDGQIS
jgi:hypothetical protein